MRSPSSPRKPFLRDAHCRASEHCRDKITPMDLLVSMLTSPRSIIAECFERMGVTAAKLTEQAIFAELAITRGMQ